MSNKSKQESPETFRIPSEIKEEYNNKLQAYMKKENRTKSNAIVTILKLFFGIH